MLAAAAAMTGCSRDNGEQQTGQANQAPDNFNATGFPIVKEPVKLTFFTGKTALTSSNWNETMIWKEYAKMTNMQIDFQLVPIESVKEKANLMLAGGNYPDAFHSANLTAQDLQKYGSQNVFVKLNDLIDKYAPNLKKAMEKYPEIRRGITMPDGSIYSFPLIFDGEFSSVLMGTKLWLNKEWLDKLNMKEPTTTDEFYEYLKAVKSTDLNGNGKQDEIGYGGTSHVQPLIHILKGAWGLGNRGFNHQRFDLDPKTNQLRFIPADPNYKSLLEYIHKLYAEGLLDKEIFTLKPNEFYAKGSTGIYGSMIISSPQTVMNQKNYIGAQALKGPNGDRVYSQIRTPLINVGAFVITDKNKYPEATVRWMDYFYSDEGIKMYFMGFKDVTFKEMEGGQVDYLDEIKKNPKGLTLEQALAPYVVWPGGGYPGMVKQQYFKGAESLPESLDAAKKAEPYFVKEKWPTFTFTEEESSRMAAIGNDIETYVNEMEAKFANGSMPFTEWNAYIERLKKMGLDEYVKLYSQGYERYKKQ